MVRKVIGGNGGIRNSFDVVDEKHNYRGNAIFAMTMRRRKEVIRIRRKKNSQSCSFNVLLYLSVPINISAICSACDSNDPHAAFHLRETSPVLFRTRLRE